MKSAYFPAFIALGLWGAALRVAPFQSGESDLPDRLAAETRTGDVTLRSHGRSSFTLLFARTNKTVLVPAAWLIPKKMRSEADEGTFNASPFNYNKKVTSFPLENGEIGLHISSFATSGGSMLQALGRDVFLIYNPATGRVQKALPDLDITQVRYRALGCFNARASHFLLADINGDGRVDIGMIAEHVACKEFYDNEHDVDTAVGPFFGQEPVAWFVRAGDSFQRDRAYDGRLPARYFELPLIDMEMSTVDFAAQRSFGTLSQASWIVESRSRPAIFVPAYRAKLAGARNDLPVVEFEYCGFQPQKPPLLKLRFNLTVRNPRDAPLWFLFPAALYSAEEKPASPATPQGGIDAVELFVAPNRELTVARFLGAFRLRPADAGGFQAVVLPAHAQVSIRSFTVQLWGDPRAPLPVEVAVASGVSLAGIPAAEWIGVDITSKDGATVSLDGLRVGVSKTTPELKEVPVIIGRKIGALIVGDDRLAVPDVLAKSCPSPSPPRE